MATKLIFITGTDTGVGKTVLTSLLLCHLRRQGAHALALKPFCSGTRADAELLYRLQDGELALDEVNPFYFPEPVAPLVSARKHKRRISLERVVEQINSIARRLSSAAPVAGRHTSVQSSRLRAKKYLLVEGSGGLLVPLGEGYTVRDLIRRLDCDVLVVSRNRLGTINHTLLTVQALAMPHSSFGTRHAKVLLMAPSTLDPSSRTNPAILAELLAPTPVVQLPCLGRNCTSVSALKKAAQKFHKALALLV